MNNTTRPRTLFVTDLDGTLLRSDERTSEKRSNDGGRVQNDATRVIGTNNDDSGAKWLLEQ